MHGTDISYIFLGKVVQWFAKYNWTSIIIILITGLIFYQYIYTHKPPTLEFYQAGNQFFYRWDAVSGFDMPIDININGVERRITPNKSIQKIEISEFSVIHIRDWEFLIILNENPNLIKNDYL